MPRGKPTQSNQANVTQSGTQQAVADEIKEMELNIANLKARIKKAQHNIRLYLMGIVGIIVLAVVSIYWSSFHIIELSNTNLNNPYVFLLFILIFGAIFGLAFLVTFAYHIILEQTDITSHKAEIDVWEAKKRVVSQLPDNSQKQSYFDGLVRINLENLAAYYALVKTHAKNSFLITIVICVVGFLLIAIGLTIGFINFPNPPTLSYITSASGLITEFISSIFFYLYYRTVRQMKEYHDSLLAVQNILLSFKLVGDTQDENEKAKMVNQMLTYLTNNQASPSSLLTPTK